jgi:hypothetical protein
MDELRGAESTKKKRAHSRKRLKRPRGNKVAALSEKDRKIFDDDDLKAWEKKLETIIAKSGQTQEEWEASILDRHRSPRVMRREHLDSPKLEKIGPSASPAQLKLTDPPAFDNPQTALQRKALKRGKRGLGPLAKAAAGKEKTHEDDEETTKKKSRKSCCAFLPCCGILVQSNTYLSRLRSTNKFFDKFVVAASRFFLFWDIFCDGLLCYELQRTGNFHFFYASLVFIALPYFVCFCALGAFTYIRVTDWESEASDFERLCWGLEYLCLGFPMLLYRVSRLQVQSV